MSPFLRRQTHPAFPTAKHLADCNDHNRGLVCEPFPLLLDTQAFILSRSLCLHFLSLRSHRDAPRPRLLNYTLEFLPLEDWTLSCLVCNRNPVKYEKPKGRKIKKNFIRRRLINTAGRKLIAFSFSCCDEFYWGNQGSFLLWEKYYNPTTWDYLNHTTAHSPIRQNLFSSVVSVILFK